MRRSGRADSAGFTLLEILAVTVIMGVVMAAVVPNLDFAASRTLYDEARKLAGGLEFARQRTVITGTPHRLVLDIDRGAWRVEIEVERSPEEPGARAAAGPAGTPALPLVPPPEVQVSFEPLDSDYGRTTLLRENAWVREVATADAIFEDGTVTIGFERDGTAQATEILLEESGGNAYAVELRPLADAVRVLDVP